MAAEDGYLILVFYLTERLFTVHWPKFEFSKVGSTSLHFL